jgi:hypothetical protein
VGQGAKCGLGRIAIHFNADIALQTVPRVLFYRKGCRILCFPRNELLAAARECERGIGDGCRTC